MPIQGVLTKVFRLLFLRKKRPEDPGFPSFASLTKKWVPHSFAKAGTCSFSFAKGWVQQCALRPVLRRIYQGLFFSRFEAIAVKSWSLTQNVAKREHPGEVKPRCSDSGLAWGQRRRSPMLKAIRFVTAGVVLSLVITAMQTGVFTAENVSPILRADGKPIPTCGPADPYPCSTNPGK
jgi:hypothetical protein